MNTDKKCTRGHVGNFTPDGLAEMRRGVGTATMVKIRTNILRCVDAHGPAPYSSRWPRSRYIPRWALRDAKVASDTLVICEILMAHWGERRQHARK